MGLVKLGGLHMLKQRHRQHPGLARDVAADHQHHAKFPHGVGKAQHAGRQQARTRQRQGHAEKTVERAGAQGGGGLQHALGDGLEGLLQRLHHKRQ